MFTRRLTKAKPPICHILRKIRVNRNRRSSRSDLTTERRLSGLDWVGFEKNEKFGVQEKDTIVEKRFTILEVTSFCQGQCTDHSSH